MQINNDYSIDFPTELNVDCLASCDNELGVPSHISCNHSSNGWFNCLCLNKFQFGFVPMGNINAFPRDNALAQTNIHSYLELYQLIKDSKLPNCMGYRVPVPGSMNISAWEGHLRNYYDKQLIDFLKYGFPLDMIQNATIDSKFVHNHPSASQYPQDVGKYIDKEIQHHAILGPFDKPPLSGLHCSPMLTRPKPGGESRRVIVDLSWPKLASVNHNIASDVYMDTPFKLMFPTIDDIVNRIIALKGNCLLYKVDIRRAFRILKLDPRDIIFTGLQWKGKYYVDTSVPFGYRHGSVCCQRVTDAVRYIMHTKGIDHLFNYIDDFIGVDKPAVVHSHFQTLLSIMAELGIPISEEKLFPPSEEVPCLGILINIATGTLSIPDDKLQQINQKCLNWGSKSKATKKQLQSLVGSLIYIHKCVKPARLFVNRILAVLKMAPDRGYITLNKDFTKDIAWFNAFLLQFNGRTFFSKGLQKPINNVYLDASLVGLGGVWNNKVYQCLVPVIDLNYNISIVHFEMINILLALRLWATDFNGKCLHVYCDNSAVVSILSTGKGQDPLLLAMARNVWLIASTSDIDLTVLHIPGKHNNIADLLSRWHLPGTDRNKLYSYVPNPKWQLVTTELTHIDYTI